MITLQNDTLCFTFPEVARQVQQIVEDQTEKLVAELPPEWDREEIMEGVTADPMFPD